MFLLLFITFHLQGQSFNAQNRRVKIGDKPQLQISHWIANVPKHRSFNEKFIVLDFWATWCEPCLESVKHLNDLQSKFDNPDLYFIALTDESLKTVKNVMTKTKFSSIVVSDNRIINSFWNGGLKKLTLPFTILIDKSGEIRWIGLPSMLNEEIIQNLIDGKLEPYSMFTSVKK